MLLAFFVSLDILFGSLSLSLGLLCLGSVVSSVCLSRVCHSTKEIEIEKEREREGERERKKEREGERERKKEREGER